MSTAMGRRRGGRFAARPENVDIMTTGGVTYFLYVFPDGQRKSIGSSKNTDEAFAKAVALNGHFASHRTAANLAKLIEERQPRLIASPSNPKITTLVDEFRKHDPKRKKYAATTLVYFDAILDLYGRRWEAKTVKEIETTDISAALNELTDAAYIKHRGALLRLFQFAGHQGYIKTNPVAITMEKDEPEKVRDRFTWEGYQAILNFAGTPDWMRRAMRIGLYSLQRRDDVVKLHKSENKIDLDANTITVLQRKTRNYKVPVWIEIEMGAELRAVVEECLRSDVPCPYLVHYRPAKLKATTREAKPHPFAVLPGYLTHEFKKIRDASGAFDHLPGERRPTFHELRAFGIHLYEQAGYSDEYVMALSGHASKATLARYQRDHVEQKPRRVAAGMGRSQLPQ